VSRRAALKLLRQANTLVSQDVVVVSTNYLGTSMSVNSSREIEASITLLNEGLKKLRRWHREALKREKAAADG
jgi:hypothetical protein